MDCSFQNINYDSERLKVGQTVGNRLGALDTKPTPMAHSIWFDTWRRLYAMEVDETYQKMLEKLREHCEREKMSIYALAKNTNLSTSSLSNLLNGKTKPYVYTILLICDALSISITDLADKDVSMTEDEKWIISSYRSLSTKKKEMLTTYIKMLSQYEEKM